MADLDKLFESILNGDATSSVEVTRAAVDEGMDPREVVSRYMIPAMDEVGKRYEANEYFVPELLIAARAMKSALDILRPLLAASGAEPAGRVVIGTVKGDLHDIGKNLVASMLEGGGFEVTDLGVDVAPEAFIEAAQERNADLICMSALLSTTMPTMKATVESLAASGLDGRVKVLIGGAPVTQAYADEIGAHGYGETAGSAVGVARSLLS